MKKNVLFLVIGVLFFVALVSVIISCSKKLNNDVPSISKKMFLKTSGVVYKITCEGECNDHSACYMVGTYDPPNWTISCGCEGCAMNIEIKDTGQTPPDWQQVLNYFQNVYHFIDELDDFVYSTTGEENYKINNIDFGYTTNCYFILYEFTTPEGQYGSVLYYYNGGEEWQVDCNGSCDTAQEKCTEVFNLVTKEAKCDCQSDNCHMNVKQIN